MLNRFESIRVETVKTAVAILAGASALTMSGCVTESFGEYNDAYNKTYQECSDRLLNELEAQGASEEMIETRLLDTCEPDAQAAGRRAAKDS